MTMQSSGFIHLAYNLQGGWVERARGHVTPARYPPRGKGQRQSCDIAGVIQASLPPRWRSGILGEKVVQDGERQFANATEVPVVGDEQ